MMVFILLAFISLIFTPFVQAVGAQSTIRIAEVATHGRCRSMTREIKAPMGAGGAGARSRIEAGGGRLLFCPIQVLLTSSRACCSEVR